MIRYALLLLLPTAVFAQPISVDDALDESTGGKFYSGNDLLRVPDTAAVGYVAGVYDALQIRLAYCPPANITSGQVLAVVKKHMADNPKELHRHAHRIVLDALVAAWPCSAARR